MTLEELQERYPDARTFAFGDTPELITALTALVRSGKKRATCSAVVEIEAGKIAPPQVGRTDIALGADGAPALVIRTLELRDTTWATISEEMALAEGEDDTLQDWREGHRRYYTRRGVFSEDMPLIWERFEVVEDFG